jgi:hypothetical protein
VIDPSSFGFPERQVNVRKSRSPASSRTSLILMICMIIPARALTYGTPFKISPASFAIFDTVSTIFVAVGATYSWLVVDGKTTECVEGTVGSPWTIMVLDELSNTTAWGESIVVVVSGMLDTTNPTSCGNVTRLS